LTTPRPGGVQQFPHLRQRLHGASASSYAAAPDSNFQFGLTAILDGLQARLTVGRDTVQG
jgi:hypothetical protein